MTTEQLSIKERIEAFGDKYNKKLLFYTNIHNEEFFNEPLLSTERKARNINPMAVINNDSRILMDMYSELNILKMNINSDKLTSQQIFNFVMIECLYRYPNEETGITKFLEEQTYTDKVAAVDGLLKVLENVIDTYNFLDISEEFIQLCNDYCKEYYPGIDTYLQEKNAPLNYKEKITYIFNNANVEFSKSFDMITTHCENDVDYYIVEMNTEDMINFINVTLVDFSSSLTDKAYDEDYPAYKEWCRLERDLFKLVKPKMVAIHDYFASEISKISKEDIDMTRSEMFS